MSIHLRPTEISDLDFVVSAERADDNRPFITQWTKEQHQRALHDSDHLHLILCTDTAHRVGYAILQGLTSHNQSAQLRRLVVTEKGRGYGRIALRLLKALAFEDLHLHRFWLDVKDFNHRAFHLYKAEGFTIEGTLRECEKVGDRYESLILLSMLDREYFSRSGP
ncbi:MAG: GNAT family N-acetyltransferase [Elainellaceae cyanobacterium]